MDYAQRIKQVAQVIKERGLGEQNYEAIAAALNAPGPHVANPTPRPERRKAINFDELLAALEPGDVVKVFQSGMAGPLESAIAAQNWDRAQALYRGLATLLSANSKTAVQALLGRTAQTEPDPTWQPTVPGPSIAATLGLGTVTSRDVQAALHMGDAR